MNTNGYVILVGGGALQLPMAKAIKQRGYELLITDADTHCACATLANQLVPISTYDIQAHLQLAQDLQAARNLPAAVLTDGADVGPTVSALAIVFGLPACGFHAAETARNKAAFRRIMRNDLEHPIFVTVNKSVYCSEAWLAWQKQAAFAGINSFPVIIKPSDNCASRGVSKAMNLDQFEQGWQLAVDNNLNGQEIVLEECLSGQEYATDWFVTKDTVTFVNGAKRIFSSFGIEQGHINPAWSQNYVPQDVQRIAELCARKLDVTGPFKLDWLYDVRYGWCVLEAASRWSGGYDHAFSAKIATGRDLVKPLLDYALGLSVDHTDFAWKVTNQHCAVYAPETQQQLQHCGQRKQFLYGIGATENEAWNQAIQHGIMFLQ